MIARRFKFQTKVLIPVVGFLVLLPAITLWLVNRHVTAQVRGQASETLATAEAVFKNSLSLRARNLQSQCRYLLNEPTFRATANLGDPATINFRLQEELEDAGGETDVLLGVVAEVLLFNKASGELLAGKRRDTSLALNEFEAAALPIIRQALKGDSASDVIAVRDQIFNAVSMPMVVNKVLAGVVTLGAPIGQIAVQDLRTLTRTEIVLLTGDKVFASSLPRRELDKQMVELFQRLGSRAATDGHSPARIESLLAAGEHYLALAGGLGSRTDQPVQAGYVLLSSYEPALRTLWSTQQTLLLVSAIGVILSAAAVAYLVRRITRPLRELRDSAQAVGRGDLSARVQVTSRDECGELARAFNEMTGNLQTSRAELEKTVDTLRTTQAQLIQSEKLSAVGQFVAGVTHELNNPLTIVIGFSELLQRVDHDAKHRQQLDMIVKSAHRCQKIVQGLLGFARQHPPERKWVDVNELVEGVLDILTYDMRTSNIVITCDFQRPIPRILADPHQLQQVFLNILTNARHAIESVRADGAIRIATRALPGRLTISMTDNGPGIPEAVRARIFDPFFTTKPVGKGTGLGLSLSYGIIKEHAGSISAMNEPEGGTTFVIEMPVAEGQTAETKTETERFTLPAAPASDRGQRVLVVDDESAILELIGELLSTEGYQVDTVQNGKTALERIAQNNYQLIVSDWKMPGINGIQIYQQIKAASPETAQRILFMSGDVISDQFNEFLQTNGKVCLPKPFSIREFNAAVQRIINN